MTFFLRLKLDYVRIHLKIIRENIRKIDREHSIIFPLRKSIIVKVRKVIVLKDKREKRKIYRHKSDFIHPSKKTKT